MTAPASDWAVEQAEKIVDDDWRSDYSQCQHIARMRKAECDTCLAERLAAALRAAAEEGANAEKVRRVKDTEKFVRDGIKDALAVEYQRGHEAGVREERDKIYNHLKRLVDSTVWETEVEGWYPAMDPWEREAVDYFRERASKKVE